LKFHDPIHAWKNGWSIEGRSHSAFGMGRM